MKLHIFFLTTCLLYDYCLFALKSWYSRCPGINVIVWSVKCKISIRWDSFMSLSNPDGAIFYSKWFKYPSLWVCLQLNHSVNVQQPEKNPLFWYRWDTKQGELLTPGKTTPDLDCKWYYNVRRGSKSYIKGKQQYNCDGFLPCVRKSVVFWVL